MCVQNKTVQHTCASVLLRFQPQYGLHMHAHVHMRTNTYLRHLSLPEQLIWNVKERSSRLYVGVRCPARRPELDVHLHLHHPCAPAGKILLLLQCVWAPIHVPRFKPAQSCCDAFIVKRTVTHASRSRVRFSRSCHASSSGFGTRLSHVSSDVLWCDATARQQ